MSKEKDESLSEFKIESLDECFKLTWYENIYYSIWGFLDRFRWSRIKHSCKLWFQRRIRGWDDSDTYDLDHTFFEWLRPRLKRFIEINTCYPENRSSFENWQNELKERLDQIDLILTTDEFDFCDLKYEKGLTAAERKWVTDEYITKNSPMYHCFLFSACKRDFMKWFAKNISDLWW